MQIYQSLTPIHAPQGSAVALGYFDGVHCGHRAVLGAAVECARAGGLTAAAFTFELPASSTLKGGRILSLPQKHVRVASLGIEEYQEAPFDEFRALTPEDFVQKVLVDCFNAKQLFCGDNFTFGARAAGNVERLRELCAPLGIGVHIVPMAQYGGQTVSSTRIRAALEAGLPCIAECGGFMYLTEAIGEHPMVGFLPGRCFDAGKLARFGYVTLTAERDNLLCRAGESIPAHEFHHWDAEQTGDTFTAAKPFGRSWPCVFATDTLYAGYPHFHFYANPSFAVRFLDACRKGKHHAGTDQTDGH